MSVKLMWITPDAESLIAEIARVSNPNNQKNPQYAGLIKYLVTHKHWSPFEMANATFEINTSRRIAPQILRHRSFSFQEFSTRYAAVDGFVDVNPRNQDLKNRQSSHDTVSEENKNFFQKAKDDIENLALEYYNNALSLGIAKESAAFLLPMSAKTKIYINGTIRSWIHYCDLRTDPGTQLEHREIALAIKNTLIDHLPNVAVALGWTNETNT